MLQMKNIRERNNEIDHLIANKKIACFRGFQAGKSKELAMNLQYIIKISLLPLDPEEIA